MHLEIQNIVSVYSDSHLAIQISKNLIFHERTKHNVFQLTTRGGELKVACYEDSLITEKVVWELKEYGLQLKSHESQMTISYAIVFVMVEL